MEAEGPPNPISKAAGQLRVATKLLRSSQASRPGLSAAPCCPPNHAARRPPAA
jgi:hypothetical protein